MAKGPVVLLAFTLVAGLLFSEPLEALSLPAADANPSAAADGPISRDEDYDTDGYTERQARGRQDPEAGAISSSINQAPVLFKRVLAVLSRKIEEEGNKLRKALQVNADGSQEQLETVPVHHHEENHQDENTSLAADHPSSLPEMLSLPLVQPSTTPEGDEVESAAFDGLGGSMSGDSVATVSSSLENEGDAGSNRIKRSPQDLSMLMNVMHDQPLLPY